MDLVIKNGTIVTANESYQADIGIDGETISLIGRNLTGDKTIDATGMLVMPGGIDPHTHMELPFMGTVSADDFRTGILFGAAGGTKQNGLMAEFFETAPEALNHAGRIVRDQQSAIRHDEDVDRTAPCLLALKPSLGKDGIARSPLLIS